MDRTSSIALSGMQAAQTSLGATAHNIANLATPGFRRQTVEATPLAGGGGVTTTVHQASEAGEDMATDMVGLLTSKHAFLANLAVFRTGDRMLGSLLDATS
jgi:flagellar hook protein FlgE